ncbi:AMP-binding protein [Gracilimonas sp.]|uniref:AMP-binding protein n=1 Tax=Gracilimonas sp. TaxID=1974203 RepID=UPI0032EC37F9
MNFKNTNIEESGQVIVREVIESTYSQLLIPPKMADRNPQIDSPDSDQKYIGLFSSGTTGLPKAIWNSYTNLVSNARYTAEAFGVKPHHRLLMMAAPWHVAGLSWAIMAEELGCEYQFITTKKGEGNKWLKSVQDFSPDFLMTVPAVLRALYGNDWFVTNVVFGGYSLEEGELEMLEHHCEFTIQGYGQTEAGGLIAAHKRRSTEPADDIDYLCCGHPIKGVTLRSDGSLEKPAPIYIQSETAFTHEEYNSGDRGFIDQKGKVYILGRADKIVGQK